MAAKKQLSGCVKSQKPAKLIRTRNVAKIISAAEEVFAEKGFDGATMQEIADRAGLPKANIHYYFRTKKTIYLTVVESIMAPWLESFHALTADDDPGEALRRYIWDKIMLSKERPQASRIFANELIRGAPVLGEYLRGDLKFWVNEKASILKTWAEMGKMDPVPPEHLFFIIWAATQTYADFEVQIQAILGRPRLSGSDYKVAADFLTKLVLKGCGIKSEPG